MEPENVITACNPGKAAALQAWLDTLGGALAQDCTPVTWTYEDSPGLYNGYDCGATFRKFTRFIATDQCGNAAFRDACFIVVDQTPPVFTHLPQSVEFAADPADDHELDFYECSDNNAGLEVTDNCGAVSLIKWQGAEFQGCGGTYQRTMWFQAKDECGNTSLASATFRVSDQTPPSIKPLKDTINVSCRQDITGSGQLPYFLDKYLNDACGIASVEVFYEQSDPTGLWKTCLFQVSDPSGNL